MPAIAAPRLQLSHIGPIVEADVSFGDLTVLVGPQATGKSVFLQTLKLLVDRNHIHDTFVHHSMVFNGDSDGFLGAFYGKCMASVWKEASSEMGAFYWTALALEIVNSGQEEQGSVSV